MVNKRWLFIEGRWCLVRGYQWAGVHSLTRGSAQSGSGSRAVCSSASSLVVRVTVYERRSVRPIHPLLLFSAVIFVYLVILVARVFSLGPVLIQ